MPIEPHHVRYRVGTIVAMPKQPPKPPAMPYAQAVKLEARRAAERDKPRGAHEGSGKPISDENFSAWTAAIVATITGEFNTVQAGQAWGVSSQSAYVRLSKMQLTGHVTRLPKKPLDRQVWWRVEG